MKEGIDVKSQRSTTKLGS
jgi:hypothetical protein